MPPKLLAAGDLGMGEFIQQSRLIGDFSHPLHGFKIIAVNLTGEQAVKAQIFDHVKQAVIVDTFKHIDTK